MEDFTINDLMNENGAIFTVGEYKEDDEEEFTFSSTDPFTNNEAMDFVNIDNIEDEEAKDKINLADGPMSIFGLRFEELKPIMKDIHGDGKIMKLIMQKGVGEPIPYDAQVTLKYVAHFEMSDEPFDTSFTRGAMGDSFRLNQGQLLLGLEIGVLTMRKHERAIFIVHPDFAYGQFGCPPRIPPNEEVLFIVHLVDYVDNGAVETMENLSIEEKRIFANALKRAQAKFNTARDCFAKKRIKQAIREYARGIHWLEEAELKNDEEEDQFNYWVSKGYTNLAVCYNLENMPRRACNACNRVTAPQAKTFFNHGRALAKMGEYDDAMEKLQSALSMEPKNEETLKEIRAVNKKQRMYKEAEKQLWSNCLKADHKKKETAFEEAVRQMCETFINDSDSLRRPLPEALTPEEDQCVRKIAAAHGLSVTTHQRYGRETTYLHKVNY